MYLASIADEKFNLILYSPFSSFRFDGASKNPYGLSLVILPLGIR